MFETFKKERTAFRKEESGSFFSFLFIANKFADGLCFQSAVLLYIIHKIVIFRFVPGRDSGIPLLQTEVPLCRPNSRFGCGAPWRIAFPFKDILPMSETN